MTLLMWNSFQYDSDGWVLTNATRTPGTGQNGYASIRASGGSLRNASYGYAPQTHIVQGYCYQFTTLAADRLWDIQYLGNHECRLNIMSNGAIQLLGAGGASVWATSVPGVLNANVEAYIEVRVKHSTTVGEVEVRVNGNPTPVISVTGKDTGSQSDEIILEFGAAHGTRDASAFYLLNTSGPAPHNTFLGHIRYGSVLTSGNGNSSQLVGSDGNSTDNYLLVDDGFNHDSDSTYVESPTVGDKDTYAMGNLPTTPLTILAVCPLIIAKKTDAGTRAIVPVIRSGGTDYEGTDAYLGTSYDVYREAFIEDPDTAAAWTESGVNAMELGPKVTV
jgi:hypothetical protein